MRKFFVRLFVPWKSLTLWAWELLKSFKRGWVVFSSDSSGGQRRDNKGDNVGGAYDSWKENTF